MQGGFRVAWKPPLSLAILWPCEAVSHLDFFQTPQFSRDICSYKQQKHGLISILSSIAHMVGHGRTPFSWTLRKLPLVLHIFVRNRTNTLPNNSFFPRPLPSKGLWTKLVSPLINKYLHNNPRYFSTVRAT